MAPALEVKRRPSADLCLHRRRSHGGGHRSSSCHRKQDADPSRAPCGRHRSNSLPVEFCAEEPGQPVAGVTVPAFPKFPDELLGSAAEWAEEIASEIQALVAARLRKLIVRHTQTMRDKPIHRRSQRVNSAASNRNSSLKRKGAKKTSSHGNSSSDEDPVQQAQQQRSKLATSTSIQTSFSDLERALNSRLVNSTDESLMPALPASSSEEELRLGPGSPGGHKELHFSDIALPPDAEGVPASCRDTREHRSTARGSRCTSRVSPFVARFFYMRTFNSVSPVPTCSPSSRSTRSTARSTLSGLWSNDTDSARGGRTTRTLRRNHDRSLTMRLPELKMLQQEGKEAAIEVPNQMRSFRVMALWLWLWGVAPCRSPLKARGHLGALAVHWNQLLVLLAAALIVFYRASCVAHAGSEVHEANDLFLAIGSFFCVIACRSIHRCELLDMKHGVLVKHAQQHFFLGIWCQQSLRHLAEALLCWVLAVGSRAFLAGTETWAATASGLRPLASGSDIDRWMDLAAYALSTGIVFSITFCQMHFTNALLQSVDCFGWRFTQNPDTVKRIQDWNLLQALLREASFAMEHCILVLLSTLLAMLFICGVGSILGSSTSLVHSMVSLALLLLSVSRVVLNCAKVTGICGRVSPFVVSFSAETDASELEIRSQLVEFIDGSDAGFYINEMKITMADAMKLIYLCCLAMGTILTKASAG